MKKIGFIGGFEKTDLILYVSKILVEAEQKVLVVDTTINQRAKYIVPSIKPTTSYITEYQGIDVAVGFESFDAILRYTGTQKLEYDITMVDIDTNEAFEEFGMKNADENFFVTAFDNYSLKRGLETVGKINAEVEMTKVLFSRDMTADEDEYLNFLSFYYSVKWNDNKIFFPYDNGSNTVIMNNQRLSRIRFKDFDQAYRDGLMDIAAIVSPELKGNEIKKAYKRIL